MSWAPYRLLCCCQARNLSCAPVRSSLLLPGPVNLSWAPVYPPSPQCLLPGPECPHWSLYCLPLLLVSPFGHTLPCATFFRSPHHCWWVPFGHRVRGRLRALSQSAGCQAP
ncbi:unnamed protein product [Staurois parvus]|uniref:Uncharacterized protein n=1 Tax=Staurois parvus TaxID=386267 RepID=A0ABN9HPW4_9NEOB|nr:unnamed protein product [Staurois parvus]